MGDRVIGGLAIAGRPIGQWADLTGAPFVTVSPVGIAKGYPTNNGADFGPDTPGTTTSGIQEAINTDSPCELLSGTYDITDEIVPSPKGKLLLRGHDFAQVISASYTTPTTGVIIRQNTAGKNGIHITTQLESFDVDGISFVFTQSTTGHGIFFDAATYFANMSSSQIAALTPDDMPLVSYHSIRKFASSGHDSSHYAIVLQNCIWGHLSDIYSFGGGFIQFQTYWPANMPAGAVFNFGNTACNGIFFHVAVAGTVLNILDFSVDNQSSQSGPLINLIAFKGYVQLSGVAQSSGNLINFGTGCHQVVIDYFDTAEANGNVNFGEEDNAILGTSDITSSGTLTITGLPGTLYVPETLYIAGNATYNPRILSKFGTMISQIPDGAISIPQILYLGGAINTPASSESTGSGSASLGSNSPAVTLTAPYKWITFVTSDGSTVYVPAWK